MDKYALSNETQAAEDDSSALYHVLLCGSWVPEEGGETWREVSFKPLCQFSHSQLALTHNSCVL